MCSSRRDLGSPIRLEGAAGNPTQGLPSPLAFRAGVFEHYHPLHLASSLPPAPEAHLLPQNPLQDSTQDTVVDCGLNSGLAPCDGGTQHTRSESATANWLPGSQAAESVIRGVQRPQSHDQPVRLRLTENWRGQAELVFRCRGDILSTSFPDELLKRSMRSDSDAFGDDWRHPGSPEYSQRPEPLVQRLKRKASLLVSDAKRRQTEAQGHNSPMIHTDELLTGSALDFSDSSLPPISSKTDETDDDGLTEDLGSQESFDTRVWPSLPNKETSQSKLEDSSVSGNCPSHRHQGKKARDRSWTSAREKKLSAEEIYNLTTAVTDRLRREPPPSFPEYRALDGSSSREDLLDAIVPERSALSEPVRGRLSCGGECAQICTTIRELARHIDTSHDWSYRPFKCPYVRCEWWVLGFATRSQCLRHIRGKHSTLMHECTICKSLNRFPHEFPRSDAFRRHLRTVHGASD